jgi:protein TonB
MAATTATDSVPLLDATPSARWERWRAHGEDHVWLAVAAAVLLHLLPVAMTAAAYLAGIDLRSPSEQRIGDPSGAADGVNVELIDASEYERRYVNFSAGRDTTDQKAAAASPEQPRVTPKPPPQAEPEPEQTEAAPPDLRPRIADDPTPGMPPPKPEAKPAAEPKPTPPKPNPQPLSEAEIAEILASARQDMQSAVQMSSKASMAALGQASPYVRSVMRKLKETMPKPRGLKGILVVGIIVSDGGGIAWTGILKSSGKPELDRLVLDTIRATRLDPPPRNAPENERKYQITYEYD